MKEKSEAIFELRDAAEEHGRAAGELDRTPSAAHREAFLETRLRLEAATAEAIDACHHCGLPHLPGRCGGGSVSSLPPADPG